MEASLTDAKQCANSKNDNVLVLKNHEFKKSVPRNSIKAVLLRKKKKKGVTKSQKALTRKKETKQTKKQKTQKAKKKNKKQKKKQPQNPYTLCLRRDRLS